jgi:peptidyl-prolyl cis-trans isomerase C
VRPSPVWAALLLAAAAACATCGRGTDGVTVKGPPGASNVADEDVVAKVDGQPITRADLDRHLAARAPFIRSRYSSPEKRKELLDSLVRFEVLAKEAQSRGYDRDPDVLRYQKQRAIDRMIADETGKVRPEAIAKADLERVYREHPEQFSQQPAIRLEQIVIRDAAAAKKVAALAKALNPRDDAGFRRLVAEHSQDEDSKQRGGDLTFLERDSTAAPAAVVAAGFALADGHDKVGLVAGPIESPQGFHIIRLTQRRAGFLRPFAEVERQLRARVADERRRQQVDTWVAEMRGRVKIEVFEDRLSQIKVEKDAAPAAPEPPGNKP